MKQNNPFILYFFGFAIVMIAVIAVLAIRSARQRTRDMADAAQRLGFRFLGSNWRGPILSAAHKTSLLQRTRGTFDNAMTGSADGFEIALFDYRYGQGKSNVTQTLAWFARDVEVPPFELRPEGVLDRIGDALVHNDIDFESHPEFSRRYLLRSPDEENTRKLFTPSLLTYLEQIPAHMKWHIEGTERSLTIYRGGWPVRPEDLPAFLNETSSIARTIFSSDGLKNRG